MWFHLREVSRGVGATDAGRGAVVPGAGEGEDEGDVGAGRRALCVRVKPLTGALKVAKMVNFMFCTFCHNKTLA